jgi:hypothetical protein
MVLQTTGAISILDIMNEFGLSGTKSLGDLYGITAGVNSIGSIDLNTFYSKRNFNITSTTLANDLGAYNMGPWNGSHADTAARFIWNTAGAASSANGDYILFQITYNNTSGANKSATFYALADNWMRAYLNKSLILNDFAPSSWSGVCTVSCTLLQGKNLLEIVAWNSGSANPAGLIFYVSSGGSYIMRSDNASATPLTNSSKTYVAQYGAANITVS